MSELSRRAPAFLALSLVAHALLLFALRGELAHDDTWLELPDTIELGLVTATPQPGEPGKAGAPPPAAQKPEQHARAPKPVRRPVLREALDPNAIAIDAGVPDTLAPADDGKAGVDDGLADGAPAFESGDGQSPLGGGMGLGFGAGGFGSGRGGPPGAVIGLHADLGRIASTSLVLETEPLLGLLPGWQDVLAGSGLDPITDFARVFVATPSLQRSDLVVSARLKGGTRVVERAVQALAAERGQPASFADAGGLRAAPWHSRGPTQRVVALLDDGQVLIARPSDLPRVRGVAAALAERHAKQRGMERAQGAAALLAMQEDEAVALSVEGARLLVPDGASFLPLGLRLALHHIDEQYARLRIFGYYESAAAASAAAARIEALRPGASEHARVTYLGLKSAVEEATLAQDGRTLTLEARLTLHQTRYLMRMVSKLLQPRA